MGSILYNYDNSGSKRVYCIKLISKSKFRFASLNDILLITPKFAFPRKKIKQGLKYKFLILNTLSGLKRIDSNLNFQINAGIILKKR